MRALRRVGTLAVVLGSGLSARSSAQVGDTLAGPPGRRWEIGARAGGGPSAVTASLGGVPNRQLWLATVSVTRPVVTLHRLALSYVAEAVPLAIATRVPRVERSWFYNAAHTDSFYAAFPAGDGAVPGTGLAPVGLRLSASLSSSLLAYTEASGGVVAFSRAMPDPDARKVNFLGTAGAGVRLGKAGHPRYSLGYRFMHLSNANTAKDNPGFNAHVFYLGISLR